MLDRTAFRAWLVAHEQGAIVGVTYNSCRCPVATFLRARGASSVGVSHRYIEIGNVGSVPPEWARQFIRAIDATAIMSVGVTAADALAVLDTIPDA